MIKKVTFPLHMRDRAFAFARNVCRKEGLREPSGFDPVKEFSVVSRAGGEGYVGRFRALVWQFLSENLGHGQLPEDVRRQVLGNPVRSHIKNDLVSYNKNVTGGAAKMIANQIMERNFNIKVKGEAGNKLKPPKGATSEQLLEVMKNQYRRDALEAVVQALIEWSLKMNIGELDTMLLYAGFNTLPKDPKEMIRVLTSKEFRERVPAEVYATMQKRALAIPHITPMVGGVQVEMPF